MMGRAPLLRNGNFRPENLGPNALALIGNLCFTAFVVCVLVFTILAATYQPEDPLFQPSDKITTFLTSTSNATFKSDNTVVKTGEDFLAPNQTEISTFINITDVPDETVAVVDAVATAEADGTTENSDASSSCQGDVDKPIDCRGPEVFHMMMRTAIEKFKDIHFYRFGKPVRGSDDHTCDMAWRFRPKEGKTAALYKDYRRFVISRSENCTLSVESIGEYHTGKNARKRRKKKEPVFEKAQVSNTQTMPVIGETVNDALPVIESESSFEHGKYLMYSGGGDRCKSMNHYLWSFLCALGEAQYLNRTFVMDMKLCLSSIYTESDHDEEGKDFRFYFDFEHLKESASVVDEPQFWTDWNKWQKKDKLGLYLVEDFRITPMKLKDVPDTLIMRRFGEVEPDNYWYRVCEGDAESVIQRPWHLLWKSKRLMDIVSSIAARLNWDYDAIHIVRGEKAKNKELWPNLDRDTSPDAILSTLKDKVDEGRNLYIATDERDKSFFNPVKDKYTTHFLVEYNDLWDENSEWYAETSNLNNGAAVEFDGYMRISVDTEVFLRGKKQLETFNDLTSDCRDGLNTCSTSTSS
ncbi:hypothetical protein Droror1_Dr00019485 [Drosera rotundifolia]